MLKSELTCNRLACRFSLLQPCFNYWCWIWGHCHGNSLQPNGNQQQCGAEHDSHQSTMQCLTVKLTHSQVFKKDKATVGCFQCKGMPAWAERQISVNFNFLRIFPPADKAVHLTGRIEACPSCCCRPLSPEHQAQDQFRGIEWQIISKDISPGLFVSNILISQKDELEHIWSEQWWSKESCSVNINLSALRPSGKHAKHSQFCVKTLFWCLLCVDARKIYIIIRVWLTCSPSLQGTTYFAWKPLCCACHRYDLWAPLWEFSSSPMMWGHHCLLLHIKSAQETLTVSSWAMDA